MRGYMSMEKVKTTEGICREQRERTRLYRGREGECWMQRYPVELHDPEADHTIVFHPVDPDKRPRENSAWK